MPLTAQHLQQAGLIDDFVKTTFARGGNEEDLLRTMMDYMPAFKRLLDSTTSAEMDELCRRFDGFYRFASLMESLAKGLADGVIEVPEAPSRASNVHTLLPKLTINGTFIQTFIEAPTPCFALGLVEERQRQSGFLALRPTELIPLDIMNRGFRFGHALLGNDTFEVVQFSFHFYGFGIYNVLVNPSNPMVQAVLDVMLQQKDYFFFAMDPDQQVTAFRSGLGDDDMVGLKTNHPRIMASMTTPAQYETAVAQFAHNPDPPGTLLTWVCQECFEALDLVNDRLEMNPKASS